MKVFLDIAIGDIAQYEAEKAAYDRGQQFLTEKGQMYGLASTMEELSDEDVATLTDAYDADPKYAAMVWLTSQSFIGMPFAQAERQGAGQA